MSGVENFHPALPELLPGFLSDKPAGLLVAAANMYSALCLLMLTVKIYADSMEGPTGKTLSLFSVGR